MTNADSNITCGSSPGREAASGRDVDYPLGKTRSDYTRAARLKPWFIWLKPPFRSLRNLVKYLVSSWNIWRAGGSGRKIRKVNVGCGKDVRAGWWNSDLIHHPGVNEMRDATLPWRHKNLDIVFSEHFIEHLTLFQSIDFLTHAGNALREGGTLRVSTPNLSSAVQQCYDLHTIDLDQRLYDTIGMNCCFHGYGHQFLFSVEFLSYLLRELGFENIRQYGFGESDHPELKNLEKHGPYEIGDGIPNLIILEAIKGKQPIQPSPRLRTLIHKHFDGDLYR